MLQSGEAARQTELDIGIRIVTPVIGIASGANRPCDLSKALPYLTSLSR
jgi:hypothetical protein